MRNINKNVTADDFQESNCFIKVKRFYKGIASKFIRKGDKNEGNKKTIVKIFKSRGNQGIFIQSMEFRKRIENLRKQQEGLPSPSHQKREMTDASKDEIYDSFR